MSVSERTARRVRVHGEVQGVSFRYFCRQEARRLGVDGWVRNEPDGTVAAYVEGPRRAVEEMVEWCNEGPSSARVRHVEVEVVELSGVAGFSVG